MPPRAYGLTPKAVREVTDALRRFERMPVDLTMPRRRVLEGGPPNVPFDAVCLLDKQNPDTASAGTSYASSGTGNDGALALHLKWRCHYLDAVSLCTVALRATLETEVVGDEGAWGGTLRISVNCHAVLEDFDPNDFTWNDWQGLIASGKSVLATGLSVPITHTLTFGAATTFPMTMQLGDSGAYQASGLVSPPAHSWGDLPTLRGVVARINWEAGASSGTGWIPDDAHTSGTSTEATLEVNRFKGGFSPRVLLP